MNSIHLILGECRSSVDSVSQSDCDAELKMKTDSSRYQDKCLNDWKKHEKVCSVLYALIAEY